METTIKLVGMIITLPFIALEAMIKGIMCILYFPLTLGPRRGGNMLPLGKGDFTLAIFTSCGK